MPGGRWNFTDIARLTGSQCKDWWRHDSKSITLCSQCLLQNDTLVQKSLNKPTFKSFIQKWSKWGFPPRSPPGRAPGVITSSCDALGPANTFIWAKWLAAGLDYYLIVSQLSQPKSLVHNGQHNVEYPGVFIRGKSSFIGFQTPASNFCGNKWSSVSNIVSRCDTMTLIPSTLQMLAC